MLPAVGERGAAAGAGAVEQRAELRHGASADAELSPASAAPARTRLREGVVRTRPGPRAVTRRTEGLARISAIASRVVCQSSGPASVRDRRHSRVKPAADPAQRARESLVHVLLNHNDFVTVR